ncbi:MAG: hypothetical protein R3344_09760, partial [Acidobacteriota bacterium]|nr:hypothetical protein [Acidobacteriota bacterium]
MLAVVVSLLWVGGAAMATDVTFRLVDQSSNLIPLSQFDIDAGAFLVSQNGTVTLAAGAHTVQVRPGRDGV